MRLLPVAMTGLVLLAGCTSSGHITHGPVAPDSEIAPAHATSIASQTTVVATWTPGLDAHTGTVTTRGAGPEITRLLTAMAGAPQVKKGVYSCPADSGVQVTLSFGNVGRPPEPTAAHITLTGCAWVFVAHRQNRWIDNAVASALRPLAPRAWQRYLVAD